MATEYNNPKIVTDNLVLYLDATNTKSYPGSGTTWNDISGKGHTATINGATFQSPYEGTGATTFTCRLRADYNVSWTQYSCMGGSDRDGNFANFEGDPTININVGDTITFDLSTDSGLNSAAGNLWITTTRPNINAVNNPTATNNGSAATDISWTPNAAGTYYYQNASHTNMWGAIIVTDVPDPISDCFVFDGTNDYAKIDDSSDFLFGTGSFTEEAWHKRDGNTTWETPIVRTGANSWGGLWVSNSENFYPYHYTEGSGGVVTLNTEVAAGTNWMHHVTTTTNTGSAVTIKVYINGVLLDSGTTSVSGWQPKGTSVGDSDIYIGGVTGADYWYDGKIAICRIYKGKALSAAEVKQNYNAHKARFGL